LKKLIILCLVLGLLLTGCNFTAKHFGGTINIDLPEGKKLVTATWKDNNLWLLTRDMNENDIAETYLFKEGSNFGVLEGKVVIKEV